MSRLFVGDGFDTGEADSENEQNNVGMWWVCGWADNDDDEQGNAGNMLGR